MEHMQAKAGYYRTYSDFLSEYFDGKVQKLSVNAGFTCPNRDGTKGRGGCTYCNNHTFNPDYCSVSSVRTQLEKGKQFFSRKYQAMKYLAYFQAYTNTYGDVSKLKGLYEEALSVDGVCGLVIGTRPDCVGDDLLDYLAGLHRRSFVLIEYGIESVCDETLRLINRGHDFACSADAVRRTSERGIPVGAHVILGLPGEGMGQMLEQSRVLSHLPLNVLKLHQLQIVKGTAMAKEYRRNPHQFQLLTPEEYASIVAQYLELLRPTIAVERFASQSPADLLIAPSWGLKNYEFTELVKRELIKRDSWQGKRYVG